MYKKTNRDEYDYLPLLPAPMLFVYQMDELLMDVASRIQQRVLPLFVEDVPATQQAIIEWMEQCAAQEKEMHEHQEREWRKREEEERLEKERQERERQKWKQDEDERRKAWSSKHANSSSSNNSNTNANVAINGVNHFDDPNDASMQVEGSNAMVNQAQPTGRYSGFSSKNNYHNNNLDDFYCSSNNSSSKKKKKDSQKYVLLH